MSCKKFNMYAAYVWKTCRWLTQLAKDKDLSLIWVYWDYAWAMIRHWCLIRQYVLGDFWRLSTPERRKRLTYHRIAKLFRAYNREEGIQYLNEKAEFNAYFKDFVHRDWVFCKDTTRLNQNLNLL